MKIIEFNPPIKITSFGIRQFTIKDGMDNEGLIDNSSEEVPYRGGDAHNIRIELIDNEPHIQLIQYVQKTDDHVDIYAVASDINLNSIGNLEYLGKLIAEKVQQFKNPEL